MFFEDASPPPSLRTKLRADAALVSLGLCDSLSKAQALIMAGQVLLGDSRIEKAGQSIAQSQLHTLRLAESAQAGRYVGRGGIKLEAALKHFHVNVENQICLDVGASTGGFTDCLLQHGAAQVLAVDVGYNQLAWRLRQHPQVVSLERCHINRVAPETILSQAAGPVTFACIDVSFISLLRVLPGVVLCLSSEAQPEAVIMALLKPQFEYKDVIPKNDSEPFRGVVTNPDDRLDIARHVIARIPETIPAWACVAAMPSPIAGASGNREALLFLRKATSLQETELLAKACFDAENIDVIR